MQCCRKLRKSRGTTVIDRLLLLLFSIFAKSGPPCPPPPAPHWLGPCQETRLLLFMCQLYYLSSHTTDQFYFYDTLIIKKGDKKCTFLKIKCVVYSSCAIFPDEKVHFPIWIIRNHEYDLFLYIVKNKTYLESWFPRL